jgi:PAS domain S-box-containing protein
MAFPVLGIIISTGIQQRKEAVHDARKETQQLADRIAYENKSMILSARQLMVALSQLPEVRQKNADEVTSLLSKIHKLNPDFTNIFAADRSGTVWATAVPVPPPFVVSDRRYFKNTLSSGQLSSGEYIVARAGNRPSFTLGYPINDKQGNVTGVIGVGFLLEKYVKLLERSALPRDASFVLLDHRGVILFRGIEPEKFIGKQADPVLFKQVQEVPDEYTFIGKSLSVGDERIISTQKLRLEGETSPYMYIRVGIPVESALSHANTQLLRNLILLSLVLAVMLVFSSFIGERFIVSPINLLERASQNLADGDYRKKIADLVKGGELGRLAESFDSMANDLVRKGEALQKSEERFRSFVENANDIIFSLSTEGIFTYLSPRWKDALGYELDETIGRSFVPFVHPDDVAGCYSVLQRLLESGEDQKDFECRVLHKNGSWVWYSSNGSLLRDPENGVISFLWIAHEITERKQAEETLRMSEEKYRNLFNNAEVGIYRTMLDGSETLDVNQKYLDIVGKSREETIGKPSAINWVDPKEREEMVRRLLADGRVSGFEYKKLNRHTGVRNCLTSVVLYREEGILEGSILDITERKRAEEENSKLEDQLMQSQKLEAVGRLAGGVAHDFNNMLGVIIGRSELALMKSEPSEPVYANLIEIRAAAERSAALTRQLLAFARKQTIAPKVINLNENVAGMLKMLQRLIGENINLTLQTASNLWPVRVDPAQIDQMLANLCVNARDAIKDVGRITIETGNSSFDTHYCATHTYVEPGEYVRIAVSDDGSGMNRETLTHIFEPFFTTKGVGEGTGLGLATVYGIVRQNNGFINVDSEPGKGTTFTICLPRHTGESGEALKEDVAEPSPRGNETILLVEDEPGILETTALMLEGQGYSVLRAGSAAEGVRLFREQTCTVHMLITDVVMPEMNGRDLAGELLSAHPQLNCLFMSGYTSDVIAQHGVLEEGVHFIQKPFSLPDLAAKVREVLDSR